MEMSVPFLLPSAQAPRKAHFVGVGKSLAHTREATPAALRLHTKQSLCHLQGQLVLMSGIKILLGYSVS